MRRKGAPPVAGMTALVPPEVIYSAGWRALDVNNGIPESGIRPRSKLCAWTAGWREMILGGDLRLDALLVVAGGDCHNALADGQVASRGVPSTHFFFYPFDGDEGELRDQLAELEHFLGRQRGISSSPSEDGSDSLLGEIRLAKELGRRLDLARTEGRADPERTFKTLISFSDLEGDPSRFRKKLERSLKAVERRAGKGPDGPRVALIGVPPIFLDFHRACAEAGLRVVFDELPHEFLRLGGTDLRGLARSYATYTFARPVDFRLALLEKELERRKVAGIIHYAQFTCHHLLEDRLLRERLDRPMLTVQGDVPGEVPAQVRLRLEAFSELLGGAR